MTAATTSRWPYRRRSRGSGVRGAARIATSAADPNTHRSSATCTGASPASSSTLMNMKLAPQMRATSRSWAGQRTSGGLDLPAAVAEHGHALTAGRDPGHREVVRPDHEVDVDLRRVDLAAPVPVARQQ